MNLREKMEIARQLARLNVDVIEAGSPVISDGDFEGVHNRFKIRGPIHLWAGSLCSEGYRRRRRRVRPAGELARIHVFLATSAIHREFKLKKAEEEIVRLAIEGVKRAKAPKDVEFSPEDAAPSRNFSPGSFRRPSKRGPPR